MSKPLSITVHPSPLKGEYLTVSDAMKQVLDLIDAVEKIESLDGGEKILVWRLTKAHTNSPPFTVVAEAFAVHPSIAIGMEADRVSSLFVQGLDDLISGTPPDWMEEEVARPIKRALQRNLNGISQTVVDYGEDVHLSIAPKSARVGIAALEKLAIEAEAGTVDWSRTEYGSVEGEVYGLTRWNGKPAMLMIERLSQRKFTSVLSDDLANEIGPSHSWMEAWEGRRLLVRGKLHYDAGSVLKRVDVIQVEERPFTDVPLRELSAIDITGGRGVRVHLEMLRGEDDG